MIVLNPDQQKAKEFFQRWWDSDKRFAILEGCAGTGKTTIVRELVQDLENCDPLFTAPTNEACKQLENVLPLGSLIRTTYAAMNYRFKTDKEEKELVQMTHDALILNEINLLIIDECSMVGQELLDTIIASGKKTLFIGHRSQLPEVDENIKTDSDCESVVFKQSYPIYTLTTPERNKGELFEFINSLEEIIIKKPRVFKSKYTKNLDSVLDYIESKEGKKELLEETSKIICWSNKEVDRFNTFIRKVIFTEFPELFLPKDRIVLLEPAVFVEPLDHVSKGTLGKFSNSKKALRYSANTKAIVTKVTRATVLNVPCWELEVLCGDNERPLFYVPVDWGNVEALSKLLKQDCYQYITKDAREKAFRKYHFIMSCFAKVKHSYAITTHRSQGMTIDKVFVSWRDIKKCNNASLRHKLLYVAASRAKSELTIIE